MGHQVTIEGSVTPSVHLARGVRRTVTVTDDIRDLVRIGAVVVVEGSLDAPDAPLIESPGYGIPKVGVEVGLGETAELVSEDTGGPYDDLPKVDQDRGELLEPGRNASREDWAEWVAANVPDAVTEGKSRDELRQIWDDFDGQR